MPDNDTPDTSKFDTNFSYQCQKDDFITIFMDNRAVTHLRGKQSTRFLSKVEGKSHDQQQLAMAKATGNFKRGNEKLAATKAQISGADPQKRRYED